MRRKHNSIHKNYNKFKPELLKVFKELRKQGIVARTNFSCCGSCGSYELYEYIKEKNKLGYVFWHRQSEESFKKSGEVCLYYGALHDNDDLKVANMIVNELKIQNVDHTWNGQTTTAIIVKDTSYDL